MDTTTMENTSKSGDSRLKTKKKINVRRLRLSLKYRPDILKLVLKMRQCIKKKSFLLKKLKKQIKDMETAMKENSSAKANVNVETKSPKTLKTKNSSSQTSAPTAESHEKDCTPLTDKEPCLPTESKSDTSGWDLKPDEEGKSIADQVKEAAQSALQQSGMVYVESAGMYYDYKTGYYYNSELGLYYHTDTGCYYYYNDEKKEFAFHSYPDRSAVAVNPSLAAHEQKKARKREKEKRKAQKTEDDVDKLARNLSQGDQPSKAKKRKVEKKQKENKKATKKESKKHKKAKEKKEEESKTDLPKETEDAKEEKVTEENGDEKNEVAELEDGECSETASECEEEEEDEPNDESSGEESTASTATLDDDDSVAKHHPPCMRIIVRETKLPKLKVGSLFLVTKDGGTVGREGEQHTILLKDQNVSRNHLELKYDMEKRMYTATDLGSKNGTFLNGIQMTESQVISLPMEVMHGSIIQLGETKLLCHIHPGNDTCGHCEPGLIMETQEKEKAAYTRTCDVKKQYELELARLKNKYKPEPLMIEDGSYNDRARARREAVGSSHHSEKTQTTDMDTHIAPENKGFKILEKMGWAKGEGLGKDRQGETAPIPLVSNEGTAGLGTPGAAGPPQLVPVPRVRNTLGPATLRLATKSKLLQPAAKAFQEEEDEED